MIDLENHKGSFCVRAPKFCQEGYCPGCEIYLKKSSRNKSVDERIAAMLQEVASNR